jgi:hypothetical protein
MAGPPRISKPRNRLLPELLMLLMSRAMLKMPVEVRPSYIPRRGYGCVASQVFSLGKTD